MDTWVWRSWGGRVRRIDAAIVMFRPGYVVFRDTDDRMLLAVREHDCNDLHPAQIDGADNPPPEWWT